jgi:hypothetical protein
VDSQAGGTASGCRVYLSSGQSIPDSSETQIQFDSEDWDLNSEFDTSTYKFKAKQAGKYQVNLQVSLDDNSGDGYIAIRKNGENVVYHKFEQSAFTSSGICFNVSDIIDLALNDTLEARVYQSSGASMNLDPTSSYTFLSMIKVA